MFLRYTMVLCRLASAQLLLALTMVLHPSTASCVGARDPVSALAASWPVARIQTDAESPAGSGAGEQSNAPNSVPTADDSVGELATSQDVTIAPLATDSEIAERLQAILTATGWFIEPKVRVEEGVAFLTGQTRLDQYRTWAGDLARKTQDVVAVVNRIGVNERSIWDLSPAWAELRSLARGTIQMMPLLGLATIILIATWFASLAASALAKRILMRRVDNRLLATVGSRAVAIPVFLLGLYLALRVSGLTQIAATVLGGTGLIGIVVGIAFRDIAENFLASILISMQRPFALGDLIEIEGSKGIVQSVTTRGTVLMTLEGNHVQIPNASIYKSTIFNMTANPNLRCDFIVGIDYADPITQAQSIVFETLHSHPAVIDKPEPMVLVEELGPSTVNLRIYFWIDGSKHSPLKVRSSVIRQTKQAIDEAGLTMPDESREIIFPKGVPVDLRSDYPSDALPVASWLPSPTSQSSEGLIVDGQAGGSQQEKLARRVDSQVANEAEANLASERDELLEQARTSRNPESGENLLETKPR